jgi:signal transduction histidine kinase
MRSPLGRLLHALNQPLTGLQCSMEVALASPRTPEQYVQGLREGLELTERMRALVEAIREIEDGQEEEKSKKRDKDKDKDIDIDKEEDGETTDLKILLREVVEDLEPVAAVKQVRIAFDCADFVLPVKAGRRRLGTVVFRFVESALSLAGEGSALEIECGHAPDEASRGESWIRMRWTAERPQGEFSRPELGLLVAQAGWERTGARWERGRTENRETVTVRLPGVRGDRKPGKAQGQ